MPVNEASDAPFGDFGVNVRVLWPGGPNAMYHSESGQGGFLVLAGEYRPVRLPWPPGSQAS